MEVVMHSLFLVPLASLVTWIACRWWYRGQLRALEGSLPIEEPEADLSVVAAVASSVRNRGLSPSTAVFGEVGLSGEIRGIPQAPLRIREAVQMGFTRIVLPTANLDPSESKDCQLIGVRTVGEALDELIA